MLLSLAFLLSKSFFPFPMKTHFNSIHSTATFTMEPECDDFLLLPAAGLRREDGSFEGLVFRKRTWVEQYIYFHSLDPLSYKRDLDSCQPFRLKNICSPETLDKEIIAKKDTLRKCRYRDPFLMVLIATDSELVKPRSVRKNEVFITTPFKSD